MNSENNITSKPYVLTLRLTNKLDLRIDKKIIALSNLSIYYTWKNILTHKIIINLKYPLEHGMKNLNYQMDLVPYLIFRIIWSIF